MEWTLLGKDDPQLPQMFNPVADNRWGCPLIKELLFWYNVGSPNALSLK
jgi:hypothetical protein